MGTRILVIDDFAVEVFASDGQGDPVFLFHGNSGAADNYQSILQSALGQKRRLVAVSFPGHGGSSSAREPEAAYNVPALGQLAARVVKALGSSRYWLVGQSVGGHALTQNLSAFPGARGLFLISAPPVSITRVAQAFKPDPSGDLLFKGELDDTESEHLANCFSTAPHLQALLARNVRRTDRYFRPALGASIARGQFEDELQALERADVPIAVLGGTEDAFLQTNYFKSLPAQRLWTGAPILFEGNGHFAHLESPQRFEQTLGEFLTATGG